MIELMTLRQMHDKAIGEINSKIDQMEKGKREKPPRPDFWFMQQEDLLHYRRCVLFMIEKEMSRRVDSEDVAA